ncbi:hypothetical protein [Actinomadura litoris]|uniref:hypothetical protein n=1 Tax=Actinomadura litoris TaxID=2678616 RepID=UPI0015653ABA|nr:hypothetical protein [Actinomadura litoris]
MAGDEGDWWFCLKHMKAEHGPGCPDKDRMGPYASQDAASHAMERARERNEQWRERNED